MTCVDSIAQYEASLTPTINSVDDVIGTFSLNQHWPNGSVGHGSGWLHYIGTPIASWPDVTVFVGHANMSYAPNGNPVLITVVGKGVASQAGVGIAYPGAAIPVGTELVNLDCATIGEPLVITANEKPHPGSAQITLPAYDLLTLGVISIFQVPLFKVVFSQLAPAGA
jgi:hypothetical protein